LFTVISPPLSLRLSVPLFCSHPLSLTQTSLSLQLPFPSSLIHHLVIQVSFPIHSNPRSLLLPSPSLLFHFCLSAFLSFPFVFPAPLTSPLTHLISLLLLFPLHFFCSSYILLLPFSPSRCHFSSISLSFHSYSVSAAPLPLPFHSLSVSYPHCPSHFTNQWSLNAHFPFPFYSLSSASLPFHFNSPSIFPVSSPISFIHPLCLLQLFSPSVSSHLPSLLILCLFCSSSLPLSFTLVASTFLLQYVSLTTIFCFHFPSPFAHPQS